MTSKPDFKVMVLLLVFMQLTRELFAIAKFLLVLKNIDLCSSSAKISLIQSFVLFVILLVSLLYDWMKSIWSVIDTFSVVHWFPR